MNIMRKLRGSNTAPSASSDNTHPFEDDSSQHTALGLMHLKKLFTDYIHTSHMLTDKERNTKLYTMIPLFCKVFGRSPCAEIIEKFCDINSWCSETSALMVAEIRHRASNQSTETASKAIASFLEIENCEESSNGWMLLSTLNLLAAANQPSIIKIMVSASLPSTLVKCLYLFFDLPPLENEDQKTEQSDFTPKERRILLQKIFVQILVRLCSNPLPAEELAAKDDLSLLFSAITSSCPTYNATWRKSSAEVLITISQHGLTPKVIQYIHGKNCIELCVDNLRQSSDLSPLEIVDMFVTVSYFLKDSSDVAQVLLDDFNTANGYSFLSDFLLSLENDESNEAQEAMRNLVLIIASLSMSGYSELKPDPDNTDSRFQHLGFTIPQPKGPGQSVRNISAFSVLQNTFICSESSVLCCTILDAISNVYHSDNANYFILGPQNTLPQFAEHIHLKNQLIQENFFKLIEFIVFQLNFVPVKELVSMAQILKTFGSTECTKICLQTLLNILKHNSSFKDVYRDVGILEGLSNNLRNYTQDYISDCETKDEKHDSDLKRVINLTSECLVNIIMSSQKNCKVFKECGGAHVLYVILEYTSTRQYALAILREMILSTGGEEEISSLLGILHSRNNSCIPLKSSILKLFLNCMKESHRTRTIFRKVDGFVYAISALVSMEGWFMDENPVDQEALKFAFTIFNTITIAMRFEPANAKYFHQEICLTSLCDTLRLLGCFSNETQLDDYIDVITTSLEDNIFHNIFTGNISNPVITDHVPKFLSYACLMMRMLYDVALDLYDKPNITTIVSFKSPAHRRYSEVATKPLDCQNNNRRAIQLNLVPSAPEPVIVHAGVIIAMLQLLPSIYNPSVPKLSLTLQVYIGEVIRSLVRGERNQQLLCDAGFPTTVLKVGRIALLEETHPLHTVFQYMLERLAIQLLEPKDLREFLRLGEPLCSVPLDLLDCWISHGSKKPGGTVPLSRVKTLVSMTTPRDPCMFTLPPFFEMDLSSEGFGCLFLPSIAPQSPISGPSVVNVATLTTPDMNVIGGIGTGDRMFPPQSGLSYSAWLCVEKFSEPRMDPHPVRLLTLIRNIQNTRDHLVCLAIVLSARDRALTISTQETPITMTNADWEPEVMGDSCARIWYPDLVQEGQWHHIVIVLNRAVLKNSSFSLYMDGQHIHTQKLHYISQNPGGGAANLTIASSVYGYIGTPPIWRKSSKLTWKQGPCCLLEEVLNPHAIKILYQLGPHYFGSLQAPDIKDLEHAGPLVSEEKIIFGLNARAVSQLTLAKIRKIYSRVDSKSIAKQLGMSTHENATPIRIMHNTSGHLAGSARSLGGVVLGYLGVRTFYPRPVLKLIDNIGGCSVLLGLIAMARDMESLYAAVKALSGVLQLNATAKKEMERKRGYQLLALCLRRHKHNLNAHILHIILDLVITTQNVEAPSIPDPIAFNDLICELNLWQEVPSGLLRSLLEQLFELVSDSNEKKNNLVILRNMEIVRKMVNFLPIVYSSSPPSTVEVHFSFLGALLEKHPLTDDLLCFGQYIVFTLNTGLNTETNLEVIQFEDKFKTMENFADLTNEEKTITLILLRNRCLQLMHSLLFTNKNLVCTGFCEDFVRILGFDWVLLFMQSNIHSSSVIWAYKILATLCSIPTLIIKFREASSNGGWLFNTEIIQNNRANLMLNYQLSPSIQKSNKEVFNKMEALNIPGFQHLSWFLIHHTELPELYYFLLALMLGQPIKILPKEKKLNLDGIWNFMFGVPMSQSLSAVSDRIILCPEAVTAILFTVRLLLNQENREMKYAYWLEDHPVTIIQFLFYLYHNLSDWMPAFMTSEILHSLSATLFPFSNPNLSEPTTPNDDCFVKTPEGSPSSTAIKEQQSLTLHPSRKFVIDFLRVIVVDSLLLPVSSKSLPPLDLVLDASPEGASSSQVSKYQTELLSTLMDHLLAADIMIGEQAAVSTVPGGCTQNIPQNVCYLTCRVVDKLWQGVLIKDAHEVFDFIMKLIVQAKRRPCSVPMEGFYHCLNRTTLFLLSRNTDSIASQMPVLEALHKLTTHRTLVFGAGNHELDFVGCLIYCLLQLTSDMKIILDTNAKTTWHINPNQAEVEEQTTKQGQNLMAVAAKRVWEELYISKKPAIEEVFKIPLPMSPNNKAPDLHSVRELIYEIAQKHWLTYIDMEKKSLYKMPWELQTQIQSKIQKVTGGLTRLASRGKVLKRDESRWQSGSLSSISTPLSRITKQEWSTWAGHGLNAVCDLVSMQVARQSQHQSFTLRYILDQWYLVEQELTRERGLWGPFTPCKLDKWVLDMTEGPCRMRKKMVKNQQFYIHYPYRPELESGDNKGLKYRVATSYDSKEFCQKYKLTTLIDMENLAPQLNENDQQTTLDQDIFDIDKNLDDNDLPFKGLKRVVRRSTSEPDEGIDDNDIETGNEDQSPPDDNHTIIRLLEPNEKISHMFRCARIQGLDTYEGMLLFGKEHVYIVDGFTLLKTREIRDIDTLLPNSYEPLLPSPGNGSPTRVRTKKQSSKFSYDDIREVHKRRYLLQPIAVELFSADGRNHLLALPRKLRNKVFNRFMAYSTSIADNAHQSVAGQKRTANVEQSTSLLSNLMGETTVTQRWVKGEISNFQYLMHLNTLAGRSYNDLMQYPVFPWILNDYESDNLDFSNPFIFRDFSKPMGAQCPQRLEQFLKRYREWDDPHGETPPYHYGTHYSSAMIVCSYLVRMEPFTQHFLRLQGGHFDLADRMFNSVREAWLSASKTNMADVKELIPEFFYLPEFFINYNNFDLGCKQNGVQLNDVVLPPWAKDDPHEFIRIHRAALESEYVSQHLHEWIDLIFGYKQSGQPAVQACNLFHHLFYEGNVDIYSIDDPLKKNATIGFINNFGQIPKQLFKKPHPSKKQPNNRSSMLDAANPILSSSTNLPIGDKLFFYHLDNLKPSLQPIKELKGPVGQILQAEKNILAVEQNKALMPPSFNKTVTWGFADHSLRLAQYETDKPIIICEISSQSPGEIVTCVCPTAKTVITAGTSTVLTVWELDLNGKSLKIVDNLYGHTEAVTCLAASDTYNIVVSGSRDCTAIVWDLSTKAFVRQLKKHSAPVAAIAINNSTGQIASCAGTMLHVYTINGEELANVDTSVGRADRMQQILCVAFSQALDWDPQNVIITGSSDGVVRMWSMEYVQVPKTTFDSLSKELSASKESIGDKSKDIRERGILKTRPIGVQRLVKQMSVSSETINEQGSIIKSGSESSLSEQEPKTPIKKIVEKTIFANENDSKPPVPVMRKKKALKPNPLLRKSECNPSSSSDEPNAQQNSLPISDTALRLSKSETNLIESFVIVDQDDTSQKAISVSPLCSLREGFQWQRQLVFRSKLTMHTAYDRKDNTEPASITCISISKDHRTVYIGDARGRVFTWNVVEQPGKGVADHWLKDEGSEQCNLCEVKFSLYERRHHCRNCGQLFCSKCSKYESEISRLRILKPVRVCKPCHTSLQPAKHSS
ncbi:WD repeat and FYVE domain-containing protein 3 [Adelges cooleyi]|uniref:WD repeat and FYVE domain-containing protein 3 n=1 Tax=Adelges cooleyi TaxID=133065 RepID=UPI00217F6F35|nr:WD repeat and FYVE domain-containing protein 3 [Adelges cooleyi]XP_050428059.1 WD repeat and FYVE domain-containing protein 3 [Adelges cooleyi]